MKKPYGLTSPVEPGGQAERVGELQALLARVEAAAGADRVLDHAIWRVVAYERETTLAVAQEDPTDTRFVLQDADGRVVKKTMAGHWRWAPTDHPFKEGEWVFDAEDGRHYHYGLVTKITASLDAALALVQRCKPDWAGLIHLSIAGSGQATIEARDPCDRRSAQAFGHTPALAICAALLKALLSTEAQPSVCEQGEQGNPVEDEP